MTFSDAVTLFLIVVSAATAVYVAIVAYIGYRLWQDD